MLFINEMDIQADLFSKATSIGVTFEIDYAHQIVTVIDGHGDPIIDILYRMGDGNGSLALALDAIEQYRELNPGYRV